jgi:phytanoyl-CoA hydroxylase
MSESSREFEVYRDQIPTDLINALLVEHEKFKRARFAIFRAQGTTKFEYPKLDNYGNQINSMHNPHLQGFYRNFSKLINNIIYHSSVSRCLNDFTAGSSHIHFQSMLFDKSTGTKLHQDTWYLDTNPAGALVGIWFALEDIVDSAGPFCLYRNSPQKRVEYTDFCFDDLENDLKFKAEYPEVTRFDFLPKKGDILLWRSFVIHGAHRAKNPANTRKSLTAHFYPAGHAVQEVPIKRILSIYNHEKPKATSNPNIKRATVINPFIYSTMCLALNKIETFKTLLSKDSSSGSKISELRRLR